MLEKVLSIENQIGRVRSEAKWQERLIDIDILFYNNLILDEGDLKIPHPLLHKRKFTLLPLQEIAPELVHPILHKTISELLSACEDKLEAKSNGSKIIYGFYIQLAFKEDWIMKITSSTYSFKKKN